MPGSAGTCFMTVELSTAMTPTGTPPRRARPVTTVPAHPACASVQLPRSKRPVRTASAAPVRPAIAARASSFSPGPGA